MTSMLLPSGSCTNDRPNHGNQAGTTSRLEANLDLFRSLVAAIDDVNTVWNGLQRLEVVSVTLDQGRDEPQLVFESMNSTGLDLETSDLVRNYMLMGCPIAEQNALYADYWLPPWSVCSAVSHSTRSCMTGWSSR